jgi:hypothetical protein
MPKRGCGECCARCPSQPSPPWDSSRAVGDFRARSASASSADMPPASNLLRCGNPVRRSEASACIRGSAPSSRWRRGRAGTGSGPVHRRPSGRDGPRCAADRAVPACRCRRDPAAVRTTSQSDPAVEIKTNWLRIEHERRPGEQHLIQGVVLCTLVRIPTCKFSSEMARAGLAHSIETTSSHGAARPRFRGMSNASSGRSSQRPPRTSC